MASSSSSSTTNPQEKYDVFLSFRGEDTRVSFTSHLYAALKRKQILTFIDYELNRGEEISPSLLKAIEESKLSVVVFSENYASSKWCLEELAKILECKKIKGQIVIPVFYGVDPSHVRNQVGSFADAFGRHEQLLKEKMDKVQNWRAAMKEAANLSGWDSQDIKSESEFVEDIVKDILSKLHKTSSSTQHMSLVGIDARIKKVESLLNMDSQDVQIVGIWGMGGIGKTTIAGAVYDNVCAQFEGFLFVANVREESKRHAMMDLQRNILSQLLDLDILNMGHLSFGNAFVMDRLHRKKVLIVLDDVDSSRQLEELLPGKHDSFGPGSKILVTSRDRQVLRNAVDEIYDVEGLNHHEALQLFSLKAFKNYNPTIDHIELVEKIVDYAQGNPLALIVLGCALNGRSKDEWYSALNKLGKVSNREIQNLLRITYDGLDDEQQEIFLDIAFFFNGANGDRVTKILDGCYSSAYSDISILIDKSLITIPGCTVKMHDSLQEMAFSIVREESKIPGKRSRLCDPEDVYHASVKKKGTETIEGICLEMSESHGMHLKSDTFLRMDRLRLLKFYDHFSWDDIFLMDNKDKVHLPHSGLDYLSDELRYLHWDGFPSKTLPQNFCAENIVELMFPDSKIERLWTGLQNLVHLRCIDLSGSPYLLEIPDLSKAKSLESINLKFCKSLIEVHSSIQFLSKLEVLQLSYCDNLTSLPISIDSKVLRILDLSYCKNVRLCPVISGNSAVLRKVDLQYCSNITKFLKISGKIKYLYLQGTAIEEVPSSIEFLTALVRLCMTNCKQLSSLPSSICKLKSLEILGLSSCSKLESFPEIMEPMESLRHLELDATAIQELPSSIKYLKFLTQLKLGVTAIKELSSSIVELKSLTHLDLSGTAIKDLPSSIERLKCLKHLDLSGTDIRKLPELPLSLSALDVNDCESLETLLRFNLSNFQELNFANCFKLGQKELMTDMQLKIQVNLHKPSLLLMMADHIDILNIPTCFPSQSGEIKDENFQIVLPKSEIPLWLCDQNMGSSVTKQFPLNCHQLKGIAFCVVFASPIQLLFDCVNFGCKCNAKSNNGEHVYAIFMDSQPKAAVFKLDDLDHMLLWYESSRKGLFSEYSGNEVTFEFNNKIEHSKIKKCGIYFLFDNN